MQQGVHVLVAAVEAAGAFFASSRSGRKPVPRGWPRKTAVLVGLVMAVAISPAMADGKLTEQNMTQRDYQRLTETTSSVEGEPAAEAPRPVHNLSEADEKAVKDEGGVKVIPGKDWKSETPEQRDAHIRRIRATMQEGARLVVSVPKGDVWLIPGVETDERDEGFENYKFVLLIIRNVLRPWTEAERAALPRAVARDKSVSQSDKHGTTLERVVQKQRE
jgi:hypothetical protein